MSVFFTPDSEGAQPSAEVAKPKRFMWLRRLGVIVAILVVVSAVASAIYVGSVSQSFTNNIQREELLPPTAPTAVPGRPTDPSADPSEAPRPPKGDTDAVNYVLMGSDSRNAANAAAGRSDTLMVLHLAADRKSAYLISFPRDMYVSIPGRGKNKINAAFAFGGPQLTIRTLEGLLGTRMDHAALVDFDGFIQLTEELGGVSVYNKHYSKAGGYEFPKGRITVQGEQALYYVRERYQLPNGDLDRAERQRIVVQAILDKGLSVDTIASPAKLNSFVAGIARHMTVDSELSDSDIRKTALSLRFRGKDVKLLQAPISGFGTVGGQSIDVVDQAKLKELSAALKNDAMHQYVRDYPNN